MLNTKIAINTMHPGRHTHTKTSGCVCARLPTQKCNKYPLICAFDTIELSALPITSLDRQY